MASISKLFARSQLVTVTATAKIATSISAQITPTSGIVPFTVTIWGRLTEPTGGVLNGKTVNLYNVDASGNPVGSPIASTTTSVLGAGSPGGDYTFSMNITAGGTYRFVTEFPGDETYEGCAMLNSTYGLKEISGIGSKLLQKRSWVVIVGNTPPVGDVNNGNSIATFLRRKLNLVPIRGSWTATYASSRSRVTQYANILLLGGPIANEFTYKLNDLLEPKYNIIKVREKTADETWADYVTSGGLQCPGFIINGVALPGADHMGAIGTGQQKMGIRASQIVALEGWAYEDTCVLAKAFMEAAGAGVYDLQWTAKVPNMDINPEGMAYTKRP